SSFTDTSPPFLYTLSLHDALPISDLVDVPLVLHGASGVPDEAIKRAISLGICKVNIDTNLRQAFVAAIVRVLSEKPGEIDPRKLDRKSTRLNSSHVKISYAVFCLK